MQGLRFGGVSGRGTGPNTELCFLTCTKRRKMAFFEGCPVGWGGVPTGAGPVDGGLGAGLVDGGSGRRGKRSGGGARASVAGG